MRKLCFKCGIEKSLDEFYKHPQTKDGHLGKCKECTKLDVTQNREDNIDYYLEYDRKRYFENGHRYTVDKTEYNKTFRRETGKGRIYCARRRARKLNAKGSYTAEEFYDLCEYYEWTCLCCSRNDVNLTADHVIPLSKDGSDYIENIQPLCRNCNSKKSDKEIDYR